MGNALEVRELCVRFGATSLLSGLGFDLPAGASLVVLGPNGAGKTVLFRALIGALPAGLCSGTIRWAPGTSLGYVPQKLDLERDLPITGNELLAAKARVVGAPRPGETELARVGLGVGVGQLPIGALSGGQFQRLLVALALVGDPTVLLLDEPVAGVDEPGQLELQELLHRLQAERGTTILLISHDLSVVHRHATHVLCLARGKAWFGAPREILTPELLRELYGAKVGFHVHAP